MNPYALYMSLVKEAAAFTRLDAAAFAKQFGHLDAESLAHELSKLGDRHGARSVQFGFHPDMLNQQPIPPHHRAKLDQAYKTWQGQQPGAPNQGAAAGGAGGGAKKPPGGSSSAGSGGFHYGGGGFHYGGSKIWEEYDDIWRQHQARRAASEAEIQRVRLMLNLGALGTGLAASLTLGALEARDAAKALAARRKALRNIGLGVGATAAAGLGALGIAHALHRPTEKAAAGSLSGWLQNLGTARALGRLARRQRQTAKSMGQILGQRRNLQDIQEINKGLDELGANLGTLAKRPIDLPRIPEEFARALPPMRIQPKAVPPRESLVDPRLLGGGPRGDTAAQALAHGQRWGVPGARPRTIGNQTFHTPLPIAPPASIAGLPPKFGRLA